MTAIRYNGKMALEFFIEDILEMGLSPVNPVLALQSLLIPVYHLAMERDTRQRRAIRRVIEEVGRPLSPQEVLKIAQIHMPRLGIATVYRTLKGLVEEGWLVQVELPGEPPRYETATKAHHHHFQCRTCGQVYEIEGCPQDVQPLIPSDFLLEGHYMVLYGQCATCVKIA